MKETLHGPSQPQFSAYEMDLELSTTRTYDTDSAVETLFGTYVTGKVAKDERDLA